MRVVLALMLAFLVAPTSSKSNSFRNSRRQKQQIESPRIEQNIRRTPLEEQSMRCLLLKVGFMGLPGVDEAKDELRCIVAERGDVVFEFQGLPENFLEDNNANIKSAETIMTIRYSPDNGDIAAQAAQSKKYILKIPITATIGLEPAQPDERRALLQGRNSRSLVQREGTSTVLVIRVTDETGAAPTKSAEQLSDDIFGTQGDQLNLHSGYYACSGGKLNFVAASGNNITNGVAEVRVPHNVSGQSFFTVENWVTNAAKSQLDGNLSDWTHVMYVFPDSVESEYIGYAYYNWYLSLFYDTYTSDLLVLMHEIGHNLDQQHSGEQLDPYGDGTCMMGAHVFADDAPKMCFNGAKSWWFGWYSDKHVTINIDDMPWVGKLVGIDDYINDKIGDETDRRVVARIKSTSRPDLYLMFNRQKGINEQVYALGDMVTIVEQNGKDAKSNLLGGVSELTEPYRFRGWGGEKDLVIKVCERGWGTPDFATMLVYVDDKTNTVSCPALPANPPKQTPTALPTAPLDSAPTPTPSPPTDVPAAAAAAPTPTPTTVAPVEAPTASTQSPTARAGTQDNNDTKPVTVVLPVATGNDDYREKRSGIMRRGDKIHELFCAKEWYKQAYRFTPNANNRIPQGATIESAVLLVFPVDDETILSADLFGQAVGNNVGNAPGFRSTAFHITNSPKTKARVTIKPTLKGWKANRYQKLVTIAPIVQEIVGRNDYVEGNPIEIFLLGSGSDSCRKIRTANDKKKPKLKVTYKPKFEREMIEDEIVLQISNGKDDYREQQTGKVGTGASAQQLWSDTYPIQALRFTNVTIPKGASILEARLEMVPKNSQTLARNVSGIVRAEKTGDAPPFKPGTFQLRDAKKTKANVKITNLPTWTLNKYNTLGDISPVIQEIVNRWDYKEGSAIKLILENNESPSNRVAKTYESGAGPKLTIRYGYSNGL